VRAVQLYSIDSYPCHLPCWRQRSVGQWYRSNVHIANLPEKLIINRGKPEDTEEGLDRLEPLGLKELFGDPNVDHDVL